jgi:hypothetical protein
LGNQYGVRKSVGLLMPCAWFNPAMADEVA